MALTSLSLFSVLGSAGAAAPWSRGRYGTLDMDLNANPISYSYSYGASTYPSTAGSLANVTASNTGAGTDPVLGPYDEVTLVFGTAGSLGVRYLVRMDAFVFARVPRPPTAAADDSALPTTWPSFQIGQIKPNTTRCIGWGSHYFFPGSYDTSGFITACGSDGPLLLFDPPSPTGEPSATMALAPLDHFTFNKVVVCRPAGHGVVPDPASCALGVSPEGSQCKHCDLVPTSAVLLARPAFGRATKALGSVLRQQHNATKKRASIVTQLSAWNDNQAAYSWWTVGPDQEVWGKPEDIYLKLKEEYDKAGIPVKGWEPDNNWIVTYKDGNEFGNGSGVAKNWIGRQWDYNEELYPSGGEGFVSKLGNLSMTYYTNGFNTNNSYKHKYDMVAQNEPHPNASYTMYSDIMANAKSKYAMQGLFTDFLCYRGPSMGAYQDVPFGEDGEHMWLGGMTQAAQDLDIEVQYCMALAHQVMMTLEFPAVTNTRVNGDGGLAIEGAVLPALLTGIVGLGWSKDNLRTADRCYVTGTYPNGTVKWPCGSINSGEGTSGAYVMQTQQTILATMSLGPVGIADQLSAPPDDPSATITSNKTLVMGTCSTDGTLLQPSFPLTPVPRMTLGAGEFGDCFTKGRHISYTYGCGTHLWATYTAVPITTTVPAAGSSADVGVWFTAVGFVSGRPHNLAGRVSVLEGDLAAMIDYDGGLPSQDYGAIPTGAYEGLGASFPNASVHVWWLGDFTSQRDCIGVEVTTFTGNATIHFGMSGKGGQGSQAQANVAPVFGGVALLGEAGKVTAVSSYRFSSVKVDSSRGQLTIGLRGKAGEPVPLLFAIRGDAGGYTCVSKTATVGPDGTGSFSYSKGE